MAQVRSVKTNVHLSTTRVYTASHRANVKGRQCLLISTFFSFFFFLWFLFCPEKFRILLLAAKQNEMNLMHIFIDLSVNDLHIDMDTETNERYNKSERTS